MCVRRWGVCSAPGVAGSLDEDQAEITWPLGSRSRIHSPILPHAGVARAKRGFSWTRREEPSGGVRQDSVLFSADPCGGTHVAFTSSEYK